MDVYTILVPELQADPEQIGYASLSHADAAAALNARTRTKPRDCPMGELCGWLIQTGVIDTCEEKQNDSEQSAETRGLARKVTRIFGNPHLSVIDPTSLTAVAGGLAQAQIIDETLYAQALALASEPCSRADQLGLPEVGVGHIESAREMIGGE